MKRNYTISGLKSLQDLPSLGIAQFTLNGRQFPSNRRTVDNIKELRAKGCHTKLIIHYDFIYIISRYVMFKDSVRQAIISEICSIMDYAEHDKNVLGIVMHTDWPIKKEFQKAEDKKQFITDNYNSSVWDPVKIWDHIDNVVENSIVLFSEHLTKMYGRFLPIKVYLENTTKVGPHNEGALSWLMDLFARCPRLHHAFGIVYDTEHHFAVTGRWIDAEDVYKMYQAGTDVIVHVNTVPKEVIAGSCKDRHSETTIAECSVNSKEYYEAYTNYLDSKNIPWVREVHEETMFRELGLWNQK